MQIRRQRMDDGKLRALLTAVDCGSFSKAAAQLGYTQSAMTHLVNKLEAEIGCTLLERDSQGIRLTDAGRQLLPYIQNVASRAPACRSCCVPSAPSIRRSSWMCSCAARS